MSRTAVLDDRMWARIVRLLPSTNGRKSRPFRDHRQVVEGMIYRLRTGIPWRDMPAEFGPWQTVWKRYNRFAKDGTFDAILTRLQAEADAAGMLDWNVSVDSTIVRVHQHGATAARLDATRVEAAQHLPGGTIELHGSA